MNGEVDDKLARLTEAVFSLRDQVNQTPLRARDLVDGHLGEVLGVDYLIHCVNRLTSDIRHIQIRESETDC